jgi:hypothetical protein
MHVVPDVEKFRWFMVREMIGETIIESFQLRSFLLDLPGGTLDNLVVIDLIAHPFYNFYHRLIRTIDLIPVFMSSTIS